MRLGKLAPRHDPRTLLLANYLTSALPAPPVRSNWALPASVNWGMMGNDALGDCTCAAAGHAIQVWTANNGQEETIPDVAVVGAYSAVTGYTPSDPSTDQGAVELDVLNYWRRKGIGGHAIGAFAACEPSNRDHIKASINLFGGCYIGAALPASAQSQHVWSVPPGGLTGNGAPGSWGGHAVFVVAYDQHGLTVVTWGRLQRMTWAFWRAYVDEAYAVLSNDWVRPGVVSPSGFALSALQTDLGLL